MSKPRPVRFKRKPRSDDRDRSDRVNKNRLALNLKKVPSPRQLDALYVANRNERREPELADGVIALPSERELHALQQGAPLQPRRGKLTPKEKAKEAARRARPERKLYTQNYDKARYAKRTAPFKAAMAAFRAQLPETLPATLSERLQLYRHAFPQALEAYLNPRAHAPAQPQEPAEHPARAIFKDKSRLRRLEHAMRKAARNLPLPERLQVYERVLRRENLL